MIDVSAAKQIIIDTHLPTCKAYVGAPVRIVDEDTEEHEWGWTFYCEVEERYRASSELAKAYYTAFLVDRLTGITLPTSISGIGFAVQRLMELRQEVGGTGG